MEKCNQQKEALEIAARARKNLEVKRFNEKQVDRGAHTPKAHSHASGSPKLPSKMAPPNESSEE